MTTRSTLTLPTLATAAIVAAVALSCARHKAPPRNTSSDLVTFSHIDRALQASKGAGATVAVVDWQFDDKGPAASRYVFPTTMVPGEKMGDLEPWHGSWMVSTVHRVAPEATIIPIIARSMKARDYQDALVRAIRYAAEHGAVAVTSSMGPTDQSDALRAAIDFAEAHGTIFVDVHPENATPGADTFTPCRPGECDTRIVHAGIVSVPEHPVKADAARLVCTWPYDLEAKFEDGWGFSNAPPTIGAVIALVKSANPSLSPTQIRDLLAGTAFEREGFKVLDAEAAVKAALGRRDAPRQ